MSIDVDPDWWKTLFDKIYLKTDARSVGDEKITRQEIDIFASLIPLKPDDRILDLCGGHGRHAMELCSRGFCHCTVLDYSQPLLVVGRQDAAEKRLPVTFVQGDARATMFRSRSFDHVLILGNSLGYIAEPDADRHILQESHRLLKPRGWLLLDVTDGQSVSAGIMPQAWHEVDDDLVVCRQREVEEGRVCAREMVISKSRGMIRDRTYCIRIYGAADLIGLVAEAGFTDVRVHSDASALDSEQDIGCMNHRLVITAQKP